MQLISILLFIFSLIMLAGATLFISVWHRSRRGTSPTKIIREGIGHIGISAIVEYPNTTTPLISLLDEEYPHCEAIIIIDLQRKESEFRGLIRKFHLARVNHTHLRGVRSLYRSRHHTFRRVVVVDLPTEQRYRATETAKSIASFDYILHLKGECQIARNAITYCANIIAQHPATKSLLIESIVGGGAKLERSDSTSQEHTIYLLTNRALSWRKSMPISLIAAIALPPIIILLAHISKVRLFTLSALVFVLIFCSFLYISCRAVSEKELSTTTDTIVKNFYRFLVERIKNFHYLYKEISDYPKPDTKSRGLLTKIENNREQP